MRGPKHLGPYAERARDCEKALEDALIEIVDAAANVGWDRAEIWSALATMATAIIAAEAGGDIAKDSDQD